MVQEWLKKIEKRVAKVGAPEKTFGARLQRFLGHRCCKTEAPLI